METKRVKIIIRNGIAWVVKKSMDVHVEISYHDVPDVVHEIYTENEEIDETNKLKK